MESTSQIPHGESAEAPVLNFVAHADDDLLFLSPNLLHAIQGGRRVRTVYLTAGDSGLPAASYWQDRERGARAAYAEMAGVADSWIQSDAGIAGHPIPVFTLAGQQNISLVFMRLPDGNVDGSGFRSYGFQSLKAMWTGSIAAIDAVDGSSSYTLSALVNVLTYFITSFQPTEVNTLDYQRSYGDGDHSDHHTVGYLTRSAMAQCKQSATCVGYEGYPVTPLPANVSGDDKTAKEIAFLTYAKHDKQVWDLLAKGAVTPYDSWLVREYRVDDPRSFMAHARGLTWRAAHRARWLPLASYKKLRPLLMHLPFFPVLQALGIRRAQRRFLAQSQPRVSSDPDGTCEAAPRRGSTAPAIFTDDVQQ